MSSSTLFEYRIFLGVRKFCDNFKIVFFYYNENLNRIIEVYSVSSIWTARYKTKGSCKISGP